MTTEEETIEFIEDKSEDLINHLIRADEDKKGSLRIDIKSDDTYDIVVHNGSEAEVNKVNSVSKEQLLNLLEERI